MNDLQVNESDLTQDFPSMEELCLNTPIYKKVSFGDNYNEVLGEIYWYRGQLETYCLDCGKESIFHAQNNRWKLETDIVNEHRIFEHTFICTRNQEHRLQFFFRIHDRTLTKIGQYPSAADFIKPSIRKYQAVLSKQQFHELSKAIGLSSHGVGIGSFVYLRRIFESLIERAHQRILSNPDWNEKGYQQTKVIQKIELLKDQLPQFLVEHKFLYGILSKGIHELTEQECLDYFPVTLMGIELILEEMLAQKEKENKRKQASHRISELQQKLSNQ